MTSVSITTATTPLVIAGSVSGDGFSLTPRGLGRPRTSWRRTTADSSGFTEGELLTAAVKAQSSLPLEVLVEGSSWAAVEAYLDTLDDALSQFVYETTVDVAGSTATWTCQPADWNVTDGVTLHAHVSQFFEVVSIVIPVLPTPVGA